MIQQLLVCLEGSPSGERAMQVAIDLAVERRARLVGLAVIDEPAILSGSAMPIGGSSFKAERDQTLLADAERHAAAWRERFLARCAEVGGLEARALQLTGSPAETIIAESKLHDLTVFGCDANFRFETNDEDGHTRDAILRGAGKPLLVVPAGRAETGTAVLVAYDGTPAANRAVQSFAESGLATGCEVHVLNVGDEGTAAWEIASRGCALLGELGVRATAQHDVSLLSTTDAILAWRDKLGAGLLVQGAYAHSRFSRLLWGSVTREMLAKTLVPVFLHY